METTINSIIKHSALPTAALSVLIYLQVGMGGDRTCAKISKPCAPR